MAELSKIRKNGVEYGIKDATARQAIEDLKKAGTGSGTGNPSGGNTSYKEETTMVSVGSESVVLDETAPEQTVNLTWAVDSVRTVPAFENYYIEKSGISYPRAFSATAYTQLWTTNAHGNADAFVSGHQYFQAMYYRMDGDSSATLMGGGSPQYITPANSNTVTGSGWIYCLFKPANASVSAYGFSNNGTGTGTIDYVYCIDVTALQEAGTITATTVNELAELFGGLELIPGQNYEGGSVGTGTATLSINRNGETRTVDNASSTATVKGGDVLNVEGGSVTFFMKVMREVSADSPASVWAGKKWVAFGDSLTDESINADKKYYRYIEEMTGITVVVMGKGSTGYYRAYDSGTAYGQRMAQVPADADIITIFGSVNDWNTKSANVAMGNASDTMESGTLAGYINECIDVAIEKAPYAQIALVTPMDYYGLPDATLEGIANIIKDVAKYRKIKCLDMYHESGFRVRNPVFAQQFITDYSETGESYGHPNNLAHEKLIAPEFLELLKRMILTA
jgi:lysophospholipase L1-like esterase